MPATPAVGRATSTTRSAAASVSATSTTAGASRSDSTSPSVRPRAGLRRAAAQPPLMSWTRCLPAEIHGIIPRSSSPTTSIWCSLPLAWSAL